MRRRLAWLLGLLGAVALALRALGRRQAAAEEAPEPDARADELRRRLAESRQLVEERETFEEREVPVDRADPGADADERRRRVHEEGRAAVDEMRRRPEP